MFLLPMGFSWKWKLGIIGVAFLLANVGLLANMQFPLYQTILIISLLCLLVSLLLEKRIVETALKKVDSKIVDEEIISLEKETLHREDKKPNIVIEKETLPLVLNEAATAIEIPQEEDDLKELEYSPYEEEQAGEELHEQKVTETKTPEDPLDFDEDVSFLENRVANISTNEDVSNREYPGNQTENTYMSEIEKLLEGNDIGDKETEDMPNTIEPVPQPVMEEIEEIVFTEEVLLEKVNKEKSDLNEEIEIEELIFHK